MTSPELENDFLSVEEESDELCIESKNRRRVYLLPNLLTTGALFCGFYAIVVAGNNNVEGRFISAAIAIFIAMVLDGVDGRVARLTRTQSEFGKQYDSISDMVCFGIAPALVMYEWSLSGLIQYGSIMGKVSWLTAFAYAVCAALRLARFNILPPDSPRDQFVGLASPAAAALLMGGVWLGQEMVLPRTSLPIMLLSLLLTLGAAILMVSNVRYVSFKQFEKVNHVSFITIVVLVFIFIAIWIAPAYVLFILALIYASSGLVFSLCSGSDSCSGSKASKLLALLLKRVRREKAVDESEVKAPLDAESFPESSEPLQSDDAESSSGEADE
jgi:CDP-diacylglycerol--serine O-phosphatidyltransferase